MGVAVSAVLPCTWLDFHCYNSPVNEVKIDVFKPVEDDTLSYANEVGKELSYGLPMSSSASALVYIEHFSGGHGSPTTSTTDGLSSRQSDSSMKIKTRAISMLKTAGLGVVAVQPSRLDKVALAAFRERLHQAGVDTAGWGYGGAKSVEHLFWETYQQRGCIITGTGAEGTGGLKRITRLVKIRIVAEIFGVDHCLFSRMQFMHDGQTVERKQVPLRKLVWLKASGDEISAKMKVGCDEFYAESCQYTENWKMGCRKSLEERLGLTMAWQTVHLAEDPDGYRYSTEDNVKSDGYPGLNTLYCIHEVTFRVRDPENAGVQVVGLPEGQEFATAEGDFNFNGQQDDNGLSIGSQLNIWTWCRDAQADAGVRRLISSPSKALGAAAAAASAAAASAASAQGAAQQKEEMRLIRRVPLAPASAKMLASMQARLQDKTAKPPCSILWRTMEGLQTDWTVARRMASHIPDPNYTAAQFNHDLLAFPELNLYLLDAGSKAQIGTNMSSGRTIGDEYQRTVGAFFAIYWLFRTDSDGKDGFSNGVDDSMTPIVLLDTADLRVTQPEKRLAFKNNAKWEFFKRLLVNAGLLEEKKVGNVFKSNVKLVVNEKRLVSLLALTAIHDIMKMNLILPECQKEHEPFHGYMAGDTIGDHDHALSYIMEHYPSILPSFRDLDEKEKRSVKFTQCNLCFNHGWFVQAEAPPGAIFTKFREALIRDHKSQLGQQDVALYFVHWLTDLAGAEPTPLAGCEKFVTKFPLPVLNSFLRSFEFVERIATQTETHVMEEYLQMRWREHEPSMGPVPFGDTAIAKLRLLCMAQMNAPVVLRQFADLTDEDRDILSVEMARTGCVGQSFSSSLCPKEVGQRLEGPAFLVYYGPAFLQNLGNDSAVRKLSILAEIYREARELWPAAVSKAAVSVTIRIDMIKALSIAEMLQATQRGDVWLLVKHNDSEAFVERSSNKKLNKMIATAQMFQVLDLTCLVPYGSA